VSTAIGSTVPAPQASGSVSSTGLFCSYGNVSDNGTVPLTIKFMTLTGMTPSGFRTFLEGYTTNAKLTALSGYGDAAYTYTSPGTEVTTNVAIFSGSTLITVSGTQSASDVDSVARLVLK
jgi:hypothetical protein